jgi:hypothetical protein
VCTIIILFIQLLNAASPGPSSTAAGTAKVIATIDDIPKNQTELILSNVEITIHSDTPEKNTDEFLSTLLKQNRNLKTLTIENTNLAFIIIKEYPFLQTLTIKSNSLVDGIEIEKNQQLKTVTLTDTLPQLKYLHVTSNNNLSIFDLSKLAPPKNFNDIYFEDNPITGVLNVEKFKDLSHFCLINSKLTNVEGIEKLTNLEILKLAHNDLTTAPNITALKKLTSFDIEGNFLSPLELAKLPKPTDDRKIERWETGNQKTKTPAKDTATKTIAKEVQEKITLLKNAIDTAAEPLKGLRRSELDKYLIDQNLPVEGEHDAIAKKADKKERIDTLKKQFKAATSASVRNQLYAKIRGVIAE